MPIVLAAVRAESASSGRARGRAGGRGATVHFYREETFTSKNLKLSESGKNTKQQSCFRYLNRGSNASRPTPALPPAAERDPSDSKKILSYGKLNFRAGAYIFSI